MDARRARLVDVALAVVASGSALAAMLARLEPEARVPDALAYALILALGAPMLVRRQRPGLALAVTLAVLVAYYALGYSAVGFAVPLAPALFSVAEAGRWRSGAWTGLFVLTVATWWRLYDENEDRVIVGTTWPRRSRSWLQSSHGVTRCGRVASGSASLRDGWRQPKWTGNGRPSVGWPTNAFGARVTCTTSWGTRSR